MSRKSMSLAVMGDIDSLSAPDLTLRDCLLRLRLSPSSNTNVTHISKTLCEDIDYTTLSNRAIAAASKLASLGYVKGDVLGIDMEDGVDKLVAVWGCICLGAIPLMVPRHDMSHNITDGYSLRQHALKNGGALEIIDQLPAYSTATNVPRLPQLSPGDDAIYLMTSGTSGPPKIVALTHSNITSRIEGNRLRHPLSRETRTLNWMPLDHVGGLVMFHFRDIYYGCRQVHIEYDLLSSNPSRWIRELAHYQTNVTWASNSSFLDLLKYLESVPEIRYDLSNLYYIMNGGEPINAAAIKRIEERLQHCNLASGSIVPGWGMTETSSGIVDVCDSIDFPQSDRNSHFVGSPQDGNEIRLVDDSGRTVEMGTLGYIQARGLSIARDYIFPPEANLQSGGDRWFSSGDIGYMDVDGLRILGREDDAIETSSGRFYLSEFEQAIENSGLVEPGGVIAGVFNRKLFLGIDVLTNDVGELAAEIRTIALQLFGAREVTVLECDRDQMPRTSIGKLKRTQFSWWAERQIHNHHNAGGIDAS